MTYWDKAAEQIEKELGIPKDKWTKPICKDTPDEEMTEELQRAIDDCIKSAQKEK